MTNRLPIPGGDNNTWGNILNSFLEVAHNNDGTLKGLGLPNGIASLDSAGNLPLTQANNIETWVNSQLNSYVPASVLPINVREYGAKGDGLTDDTASIDAAITAAGSGGAVFFPAGTYIFSQTINCPGTTGSSSNPGSGIRLIGAGWGTILKQANGANLSNLVVLSSGSWNNSIENLQIDGNRANNTTTTAYGLYLNNINNSSFSHIRIANVNGWAYGLDGTSGKPTQQCHFLDCWAYSSANGSIFSSSYSQDNHFLGGDFGFTGGDNVTFSGSSSSMRGSVIWGGGANGITVNSPAIQLTECNVEGNQRAGINVTQYGSYLFVSGCKIYDNSTAGANSYDGIYINGASGAPVTGITIDGNFIFNGLYGNNMRSAVYLDTYHSNCTVTNNNVGFMGANASWSPGVSAVQGYASGDYLKNNTGWQPGTLTTPAIPSSTSSLNNPFGIPLTVYVNGGTVTGIAVNGSSTGITSGTVRLGPLDSIALTYTVAPSWAWIPES